MVTSYRGIFSFKNTKDVKSWYSNLGRIILNKRFFRYFSHYAQITFILWNIIRLSSKFLRNEVVKFKNKKSRKSFISDVWTKFLQHVKNGVTIVSSSVSHKLIIRKRSRPSKVFSSVQGSILRQVCAISISRFQLGIEDHYPLILFQSNFLTFMSRTQ